MLCHHQSWIKLSGSGEDESQFEHAPVMLDEVIEGLNIRADGIYVDATYGRGGHTRAVIDRLNDKGQMLLLDRDPQAIENARSCYGDDERVTCVHTAFSDGATAVRAHLESKSCVDGVLFDLGVSSPQLDDADRGFSFRLEGPIDMRMDTSKGESAWQYLQRVKQDDLRRTIGTLGEERYAGRIARAICEARQENALTDTLALASVVARAVPSREPGRHPATRTFQAIRMVVNEELEEVRAALPAFSDLLCRGGRMVVISFHSLEDRIVKRFFAHQAKGDNFPPDFPVRNSELSPKLKIIGKVGKPQVGEVDVNPRARSARVRIAERLEPSVCVV